MGGALRRPTKFDCGAALQQSSNLFYQKFVKIKSKTYIVSVGGCGEEKGFKGKRNRRSRLRIARLAFGTPRSFLRIFCAGNKKGGGEKYT